MNSSDNSITELTMVETNTNKENAATPETEVLTRPSENGKLDNESQKHVFWKNIIAANVSMFFYLTGFAPLLILQSSMNTQHGLGTTATSIILICMVLPCFLSSVTMTRFGTKSVFLYGLMAGGTYIVANFYPTTISLIPAAIITGVGVGFGQLAFRTYTAKIGHQYTSLFKTGSDRIQSRISALAFIQQRGGALIGGTVSSLILGLKTADASSERMATCGANYCNQNLKEFSLRLNGSFNHSWELADDAAVQYADGTSSRMQVYSFLAFCVACAVVAVCLVFFFVTKLSELGLSDKSDNAMSVFQLLTGTLRQHTDVRLLLLLPLMMTPYANDAFWNADFNKAYVTCSIGMHNIGYVSVWSSLSSIACSVLFGWFNSKRYRGLSLTLATVIQAVTAIGLLYYKPTSSSLVTLCVISACFYVGSGIRQSLVPALISVVFKDNLTIAISNLHLWGSIGGAIVFGLSNHMCITTKIYLIVSLTVVSYVLYVIFEIRLRATAKRETNHKVEISSKN